MDLDLIARRQRTLGPAYRLLYEHPVHFVRANGVHLYDPSGEDYLDAYNNVPCIGQSNPAVTEAVSAQLALINTNTRYLQDGVVDYAERLVASMPEELGNVMFTCTGSEANDLAMRVARYNTGNTGVIITQNAYHGTSALISGMSPSLGPDVPLHPYVRVIPAPDEFLTGLSGEELSDAMVARVQEQVDDLVASGHGVAALLIDSIFSSDGIFPQPTTWIARAAEVVRKAGGLYIADEVQSGFGRLGTGLWGFARHNVIPDIVTMGKSMGNGYPVAAAVFQPRLLAEFGPKVRYFNTFGGSSAAVAAASAVLTTIEEQGLVAHAQEIGGEMRAAIEGLAASDPRIGCVRGEGLALGVAFVMPSAGDGATGTPVTDPALAARVVNGMRERRVLISCCGIDSSILKIRPPLVFDHEDVTRLVETLSGVLDEV